MLIEDLSSQIRLLTRDFHVAYCLAQVMARPQEQKALKTEGEPVAEMRRRLLDNRVLSDGEKRWT